MKRRLEFHPAVPVEVEAVELWQELQRPGLGDRFREDLRSTTEAIREHPEHYAIVLRDVRLARLQVFSYAVRFRWLGDRIRIVSVKHTSQGSGRWLSRR